MKGSFEGDFGVENNSFYLVKNRFFFLSFFSLLKHQKIIVFQQMCSSVYQDFPFHQSWYQTYGLQMGAKNISKFGRNTSNLIKHVQNKYFFLSKLK